MKTKPANVSSSNPKLAEKRRKTLIKAAVGSVAGIAVIALGIAFVPRLWGIGVSAASVTTYEVEAITYGNVDTTISGSGNLTPVSQQTLTAEQPVTVTAVNYAAGDAVEEGAVIVTVEDAQGSSTILPPMAAYCWSCLFPAGMSWSPAARWPCLWEQTASLWASLWTSRTFPP